MIAPSTAAARPRTTPAVPRAAFMRGYGALAGTRPGLAALYSDGVLHEDAVTGEDVAAAQWPSSTTGMPSLNSSGGLALVLHCHGDAVERRRRSRRSSPVSRTVPGTTVPCRRNRLSRATSSSRLPRRRCRSTCVALLRPWKRMNADRGEQHGEHDAHTDLAPLRRGARRRAAEATAPSGPPGPVRGVRSTACPRREAASRATRPRVTIRIA